MIAESLTFEDRMIAHLRRHFPDRCDGTTPALIREGIERAARYGLTADADVCRFIDLMFLLGRDFDLRGPHAWTRGTLEDSSLEPGARMDRIYRRAFVLYAFHRAR